MRRLFLALAALALLATSVHAQVARNASIATISHTLTGFSNLAVNGLDVQGNPGYIALTGVSTKAGYVTQYYLWVAEDGDVCLASWAAIQTFSSFPNGSWDRNEMDSACTVVGGQS